VLVKKEIKTLLSIPMYATNTLMGSVMAVVLVIAIMFLPNTEIGKTMFEQAPELQQMMSQSMPAIINVIVAFSLSISPISAVSIAIEGKYFYLMKTWPISTKQFVKAKLSLNYIFAVIPAIIIAIVSIFVSSGVSWIVILESAVCIVLYPLVSGNIGMFANLLIPNLKWENINQAVKQSPSLMVSVFYGMGMSALVGVALFSLKWKLEFIFLLILLVLVALFITTQILIYKYCDKLIRKRT
jgi:ABC-2 type transport system permease protein